MDPTCKNWPIWPLLEFVDFQGFFLVMAAVRDSVHAAATDLQEAASLLSRVDSGPVKGDGNGVVSATTFEGGSMEK